MTCSWANVMKAKRQTAMAASESCHQATKQLHTETCQMLFGSTQKREAENEGPARNGTTTIKEKRKSGVRLSAKWQPLVMLGCVGIFWQIEKNIKTAAKDGEIEGKGKRDGCCCSNRIETKQQQQQHTATLHCYVNHPPLLILTHSLSPSLSIDISSVFFFHLHRATLPHYWIYGSNRRRSVNNMRRQQSTR